MGDPIPATLTVQQRQLDTFVGTDVALFLVVAAVDRNWRGRLADDAARLVDHVHGLVVEVTDAKVAPAHTAELPILIIVLPLSESKRLGVLDRVVLLAIAAATPSARS